jgi:hypothetical protein
MRLLKLAFLSFVIFFLLITAISLLIPSHIRISKAVNIGSAPDSILYFIKNQEQWPLWHPAFQQRNSDSLLQQHNITIKPILQTDSLVTVRWQQGNHPPVLNSWQVHRFAASDSVTLQWYMDFQLPWYPWQKFSSLFYENTYGQMMERGLVQLKNKVQAKK